MPTLSVAYSEGHFTVTGGDNNGPDVTVPYGETVTIRWQRVGTNFRFKELEFDPADGPFSDKTVADAEISVVDTDDNESGADKIYKYSLTIRDEQGHLKTLDPKVINKASSGSLLRPSPTTST